MKIDATSLADAHLIELSPRGDERGFFMRTFCETSFAQWGLETRFVQHNASRSRLKGTLRGMHFQRPPHSEVKVVRCVRGAVLDVIIDLRAASRTFGQWQGFELTEDNHRLLYVPKGFAHGFQTLVDDSEVSYLVSSSYAPQAEVGVRWNDPRFGIDWPLEPSVQSDRDRIWPDFVDSDAF
jgi:dTDP-4-dehydrorhamnose 3,5-epimerase